ncbi:hypothetical protein EV283_0014 [Sphingomonas sp. BK036]|uniref:hypothetical protein n=1 Tax=Sphingomonas sp. BK036 TaxID=2512122 RepID=UPI001029F062|nr:hypothetical protein [Sphingomonas sp. BK036]RZT58247.1 hypothetical protein EV283_0014 [Sphingomonas sp. BK036]
MATNKEKSLRKAASALQAAKCARPVLFEFDDEDFPYGTSGSSVLVELGGQVFAVTAAHLFDKYMGSPIQADQLRIPYSIEHAVEPNNAFVPHEAILRIKPIATEETAEWQDLAIAPVKQDLLVRHLFCGEEPLCLDGLTLDVSFGTVLVRGFPSETREFDPEDRIIRYCPILLVGQSHRGSWKEDDCTFQVDVKSIHGLTNFDDLSGSPVIRVNANGQHQLAGIVLRGGNDQLHVLEARIIASTLNAYSRGENEATILLGNC